MEQKINVHWSWFTRIVTVLVSLVFVRIIWQEFKDFQANTTEMRIKKITYSKAP